MNLSQTCWRDEQWLHVKGGLSPDNVLDYFASSPFYDSNCNNEVARQRGLSIRNLPHGLPGTEYVLQDAQTPQLFVIRKQNRSLSGEETNQAVYYILHGVVYQAPVLYDVLNVRLHRAAFTLQSIFSEIRDDLDPIQRKFFASQSLVPSTEEEVVEETERVTKGSCTQKMETIYEDPELKAERRRRAEQAIVSALLAHPLPRSAVTSGGEMEGGD